MNIHKSTLLHDVIMIYMHIHELTYMHYLRHVISVCWQYTDSKTTVLQIYGKPCVQYQVRYSTKVVYISRINNL